MKTHLARFRGRHVGIVFQSFHLIPTMTALENVAVPLELAGIADAHAQARDELAAVGLSDRLDHYPAQLSGGEQQRVAVARALAPNPAIVVADEPTGNLDEDTGKQIIDLLFAGHARRKTTLVLVTHDPALAARCARVVRLRSGRIDGSGCAVTATMPNGRWLPLRFALRELRAGVRGFYVFIACIALGSMAIAGVGSLAASLADGLAREGQVILGGDLAFTLIQREATPAGNGISACPWQNVERCDNARDGPHDGRPSDTGRAESRRCRLSAVRRSNCSIRPGLCPMRWPSVTAFSAPPPTRR